MQREATGSDKRGGKHGANFNPVFDSRKRKVVGLWQRGSRYYAQMRMDLGNGQTAPRRLPLAAQTMEEAKAEMERKRTERHDGELQRPGHRPQFAAFAQEYLDCGEFAGKKEGIRKLEGWAIGRWIEHLAASGWIRSPLP